MNNRCMLEPEQSDLLRRVKELKMDLYALEKNVKGLKQKACIEENEINFDCPNYDTCNKCKGKYESFLADYAKKFGKNVA